MSTITKCECGQPAEWAEQYCQGCWENYCSATWWDVVGSIPPTNRIHHLKTESKPFQAVVAGVKTAELRLNDRNFLPGETIVLLEIDEDEQLTGQTAEFTISHVQSGYGLKDDYVMLSLSRGPTAGATGTL